MSEVDASLLELLVWVAERPRTYAEAIEAWRSTCPRHSVWEDATIAGLIAFKSNGGGMGGTKVDLSKRGRTLLNGRGSNRHSGCGGATAGPPTRRPATTAARTAGSAPAS